MPTLKYSDRFLNTLPEGVTQEDLFQVDFAASMVPVDTLAPEEQLVISSFTKAGPDSMVDDNGCPTIMRVSAWMCHEGVNGNRQGFVKEELQNAAKTLFKTPNFGVMDFNHSAVLDYSDEPKVIGLWYKAEYAYDTKAGKWGILATGMLWSWLFPDHADKLLADQARRGHMRFSMAAIAGSKEYIMAEDGNPAVILHNPVFFTVSALDVPPADPDARGVGSEDPEDDEDTVRQKLLELASKAQWSSSTQIKKQGDRMSDNETIQALTDARVKAELAVQELETKFGGCMAQIDELKTAKETLETKLAELETVRETLANDSAAATARIAELEAQVAELTEYKTAVELAKAEEALKTLKVARVAELPEPYRLIHAKKDEAIRTKIEDTWAAMSDEAWEEKKSEIAELLGISNPNMKISFLERSNNSLQIPHVPVPTDDKNDLSARAKTLLR